VLSVNESIGDVSLVVSMFSRSPAVVLDAGIAAAFRRWRLKMNASSGL
jgi:hypothetical protein